MSPAMTMAIAENEENIIGSGSSETQLYQKGVKHLCEKGLNKVPFKYILPNSERPDPSKSSNNNVGSKSKHDLLQLPVIDFAQLQGPNRTHLLSSLAKACEEYGFFQLVNHGIPNNVIEGMREVSTKFFELPFEERAKYMSSDMYAKVRYGTSYNQNKDNIFCWRDFLKLSCNPFPQVLPQWPSSPADFSELAAAYAEKTKGLFLMLVEAILESLGEEITNKEEEEITKKEEEEEEEEEILKKFEDGSQLMVVNCYPPCPEPELTLGMPPHSDYGFLTLLLQDQVEGLQIHFQEKWVTVEPLANSFVVNIGDHLEIFSNGRYKSVLHRVLVNANRPRISVATLHSLPYNSTISPWPKLVNEENPRRYMDTDFDTFLEYISSCEPKRKNFLESRKIGLINQ